MASALLAWLRRHRWIPEALATAAVAAVGAAGVVEHERASTTAWALTAALALPLIGMRRWPVAVFAVEAGIGALQWSFGPPLTADLSLLVALFAVASARSGRHSAAAWGVLELGAVLASVRWHLGGSWVRSLIGLSGLAAVALLAGTVVRWQRAHVAELVERAARLEVERDQQALIAAAAERTRIAREMHDVIAHSLAVVITMADAASAKLERDPDQAREAISSVAQVGRQALGDTRRLLGVLRAPHDGGELAPQPGLDRLADLVAKVGSTGIRATLQVEGEASPLPPGAELSIYRIVQEALTNVLKHAAGATGASVVVRFAGDGVALEIVDDGRAPVGAGHVNAGGHGLAGMRERAAIYGGTVEAGPVPGGFRVRARIPTPSAVPAR